MSRVVLAAADEDLILRAGKQPTATSTSATAACPPTRAPVRAAADELPDVLVIDRVPRRIAVLDAGRAAGHAVPGHHRRPHHRGLAADVAGDAVRHPGPAVADGERPGDPRRARPPRSPPRAAAASCAATETERYTGRVITIASPKGGVGKTTVSTNLAIGLTAAAPQSTVLVDLDVQFGDVASALSMVPEYTLPDVVRGPASEDTMVLKTFLTQHPSGLYAVCGAESPAAGDTVRGRTIRLLAMLAREFRYVVVDTAPGLSEQTLAALDRDRRRDADQHGRPRRPRVCARSSTCCASCA